MRTARRRVALLACLVAIGVVGIGSGCSARREQAAIVDAAVADAPASVNASIEAAAPDAALAEVGDPFAVAMDASAEIPLPGWPGWPLPKGTMLTPAVFCEGATAARLFVRNPKCSVAETRADIERNKRKPFAEFADVMERSRATRCIARLTTSVDKGRVRLEPEAGARCVAAAIDVAFENVPSTFDSAACNGYVVGLQHDGERCAQPWECVDGLTCVGFTKSKDGRCKPLPPLGARCGNAEPDRNIPFDIGDRPACARGGRCEPWGGTCRRAKKQGERCEHDWDCLDELACHGGKCDQSAPVAVGGSCLHDIECAPTLFCLGTDYQHRLGVCTEKRAAGEECRDDTECKGHCDLENYKSRCVAFCQSG